MSNSRKESAQRLLALLVIVAMLGVMGIPMSVIIFFAIVTYFIWRAVRHTEHQETGRIFEFYKDANDILREEERRWYGFEVAEVIDRGERTLHSMMDPPTLVHFALGALYNYTGYHEAAVEHLAYVVEGEQADERHRVVASPELRRYVHILRKLEREPAEAPQTMAAIRNLERARRARAALLLAESRERVVTKNALSPATHTAANMTTTKAQPETSRAPGVSTHTAPETVHKPTPVRRQNTHLPPPPIAEVLRDVYEEEKKTA
ncbi:MAG TPA: hypothetical protein VGO91_02890 [Pyrinomonadaceae bacterium]|jgi:hypothetical protein|nr:hypothetical protein [Pyrinomonadaceae bacterium]